MFSNYKKCLGLTVQFLRWYFYYKKLKVDLFRVWLGPFPIVAAFSADAVKVTLKKHNFISFFEFLGGFGEPRSYSKGRWVRNCETMVRNRVVDKVGIFRIWDWLIFWSFKRLIISSSGEKWRRRRKMLTPAFHFSILKKFQQVHDNEGKVDIFELFEIVVFVDF